MRYLFLLFFLSFTVQAQNTLPADLEPVPDGNPTQLDSPPVSRSGEQPEVTVVSTLNGLVEEYRINGQLYMLRVLPKKGLPYYLIDTDGDGQTETRYNFKDERVFIPGWVIMNW